MVTGAPSYDPDGGSIQSYEWKIDGTTVTSQTGASLSVSWDELLSSSGYGLSPNQNYTVTFTVTDDEGDTSTNTASDTPSNAVDFQIANVPTNISIDDQSETEGDSGTTTFTFTVSATNAPLPMDVTVDWILQAAVDDSADIGDASGDDMPGQSGQVVIDATSGTGTIQVTTKGDTTFELDEIFYVELSNPSAGALTDARGEGVILNDDSVDLFMLGSGRTEGHSGTRLIQGYVYTTEQIPENITVDWIIQPGTASIGTNDDDDLAPQSGQATIRPMITDPTAASGAIDIYINGDTDFEPNETFDIVISNASAGTIIQTTLTLTIYNDDGFDAELLSLNDLEDHLVASIAKDSSATLSIYSGNSESLFKVEENGESFDIKLNKNLINTIQDRDADIYTSTVVPSQRTYTLSILVNGDGGGPRFIDVVVTILPVVGITGSRVAIEGQTPSEIKFFQLTAGGLAPAIDVNFDTTFNSASLADFDPTDSQYPEFTSEIAKFPVNAGFRTLFLDLVTDDEPDEGIEDFLVTVLAGEGYEVIDREYYLNGNLTTEFQTGKSSNDYYIVPDVTLFAGLNDNPDFSDNGGLIHYSDVYQGKGRANCWLMAVFGAMANNYAGDLSNMFSLTTKGGEPAYRVTFYGDPAFSEVYALSEIFDLGYDGAGLSGDYIITDPSTGARAYEIWVNLLELAVLDLAKTPGSGVDPTLNYESPVTLWPHLMGSDAEKYKPTPLNPGDTVDPNAVVNFMKGNSGEAFLLGVSYAQTPYGIDIRDRDPGSPSKRQLVSGDHQYLFIGWGTHDGVPIGKFYDPHGQRSSLGGTGEIWIPEADIQRAFYEGVWRLPPRSS